MAATLRYVIIPSLTAKGFTKGPKAQAIYRSTFGATQKVYRTWRALGMRPRVFVMCGKTQVEVTSEFE